MIRQARRAEVWRTFLSRACRGHPFAVAVQDGAVPGFATHVQVRAGLGQARSLEHAINLAPAARGPGRGRRLMAATEDHATAREMRAMVGAVTGSNPASLHVHESPGDRVAGRMPPVGWKFGRCHNLVRMPKLFGPGLGDSTDPG